MTTKFCKDCKHHEVIRGCDDAVDVCTHPVVGRNVITGELEVIRCSDARSSIGICKLSAVLFEKKLSLTEIIKTKFGFGKS